MKNAGYLFCRSRRAETQTRTYLESSFRGAQTGTQKRTVRQCANAAPTRSDPFIHYIQANDVNFLCIRPLFLDAKPVLNL